ncbi:MAG: prolipoprotein diacylglyceryl transferase [Planctomycetota bacterium]|jgi:phosphatidylglycerol:prolipoprotein diacylglycerol transferase|nr:prolipoprotein diacylglyceryl transferase [Planctomycetota bacterium]
MYPVLFELPIGEGFPLFSFLLFIVLGIIVALSLAGRTAKRQGIPTDSVLDIGLLATFAGLVGARIFYLYVDQTAGDFDLVSEGWLEIGKGGFSFFGGLILALPLTYAYARLRHLSFLTLADIYAAPLAFALALGRLGCLLAGCCFGSPASTSFPLGLRFPEESDAMSRQWIVFNDQPEIWDALVEGLGFPPGTEPELAVYPVQVVAFLALLLLGLLLYRQSGRLAKTPGKLFSRFILLYAAGRFLLEFYRDDTPLAGAWGVFPGLHSGQWLSLAILLLLAGGVLLFRQNTNPGKT